MRFSVTAFMSAAILSSVAFGPVQANAETLSADAAAVSNNEEFPLNISRFNGTIKNAFLTEEEANSIPSFLVNGSLIVARSEFYRVASSAALVKELGTLTSQGFTFTVVEKGGERILLADDDFTYLLDGNNEKIDRCTAAVIGGILAGIGAGGWGGAQAGAIMTGGNPVGAAIGAGIGGTIGGLSGGLTAYGTADACGYP